MTKKDICMNNETFAYYSGFGGIELKHIEYGIDDYVYYVSSAWYGGEKFKKYHRKKIYYKGDDVFFIHNDIKISFSDCIRTNI